MMDNPGGWRIQLRECCCICVRRIPFVPGQPGGKGLAHGRKCCPSFWQPRSGFVGGQNCMQLYLDRFGRKCLNLNLIEYIYKQRQTVVKVLYESCGDICTCSMNSPNNDSRGPALLPRCKRSMAHRLMESLTRRAMWRQMEHAGK